MAPRAAVFDFGGVLTSSVSACFRTLEETLGVPKHSLLPLLLSRRDDGSEPAFYDLERGRMSEAEFWSRLAADIEQDLGLRVTVTDDLGTKLWSQLEPNDTMLDVARAIGTKYMTAMLTNGVREWTGLRELHCPGVFEVVVDSCQVGLRKPEPEIYQLVCDRLGVRPQEAVFVDDIPANVEGARAVGMTGILFDTTEHVVARLRALFPDALTATA